MWGPRKFFMSQNSNTGNEKNILNTNKFIKPKVLVLDFWKICWKNYIIVLLKTLRSWQSIKKVLRLLKTSVLAYIKLFLDQRISYSVLTKRKKVHPIVKIVRVSFPVSSARVKIVTYVMRTTLHNIKSQSIPPQVKTQVGDDLTKYCSLLF